MQNWAADEEAEVVIDQLRLAPRDVVGRIQGIVAQEFKRAAMKLIRAALGDDVEAWPGRPSELR